MHCKVYRVFSSETKTENQVWKRTSHEALKLKVKLSSMAQQHPANRFGPHCINNGIADFDTESLTSNIKYRKIVVIWESFFCECVVYDVFF